MRKIVTVQYAISSLGFSLAMGFVTTVHHLHSVVMLHPDSAGMHVVWNELILIPAILISMFMYIHNQSRVALWIYLLIALAGFAGLGLYEGGWNHTARLIAHLRIDSPHTTVRALFPADDPHQWFYEITGVATFVCATLASYYTLRFALVARRCGNIGQ